MGKLWRNSESSLPNPSTVSSRLTAICLGTVRNDNKKGDLQPVHYVALPDGRLINSRNNEIIKINSNLEEAKIYFAKGFTGFLPSAGPDTKLMQNSGRTKFKRTSIDRLMNTLVLWVSSSRSVPVFRIQCSFGDAETAFSQLWSMG